MHLSGEHPRAHRSLTRRERDIVRRDARRTPDDIAREPLHLLELRTELEQQQLHAGALELGDPRRDLLRRTDQPRAQAAVRDRVVLELHALLQLGAVQPLTEVLEPRRAGPQRGDALELPLRVRLAIATDDVARDAEL